MTTAHPSAFPADHGGTDAQPKTWRVFLAVWGQVWLLTIIGGGLCGLVCAGVASLVFFVFTGIGGLALGTILGLPLGLVIAAIVASWATPPDDPLGLARGLEDVGIGIALLITVPLNLYLSGAMVISNLDSRFLFSLAAIVNSMLAVFAAVVIGRECGHALAARHLQRFGLPTPPRRSLRHPWRKPGAFDAPIGSIQRPTWCQRAAARIGAPTAGS